MTAKKPPKNPPPIRRGRFDTYGYTKLEVGDSPIFIWGYEGYPYLNVWGKKNGGRRFTTRYDRQKGGIWVWRIK